MVTENGKRKGKRIGIDLGTTNSVTAIIDGSRPRVLNNSVGKEQTPSVVGIRKRKSDGKEEYVYGRNAVNNFPMAPKDTIFSIKRLMGRSIRDEQVSKVKGKVIYQIIEPTDGTVDSVAVVLGGKQYFPEDISKMILEKLKEDAECRLSGEEEITHAVITVPAYFSEVQRKATRQAVLKAGMKVIRVLDEPTAAAIAFGMDSQDSSTDNKVKNILVYDLGGGTFDISVLMCSGGTFAQLALQGNMWLGGDDFDQKIIEYAVNDIRKEFGIDPTLNLRFMAKLKHVAQETKEALSSSNSAPLMIPGLLHSDDGDLIDVDMEFTRKQFETMITPLVKETVKLVDDALKDANLTKEEIDYVLLAGNSTHIPLVQKYMKEIFGADKVMRKIDPKNCVAMGAAILAARKPEIECPSGHQNDFDATVCSECGESLEGIKKTKIGQEGTGVDIFIGNIAPYPYGTQSSGDRFTVFVEKGDAYPTTTDMQKTELFKTQEANQRIIRIPVYGGEHREKASLNEKQGEAFAILPPGLPQGTIVRLKLWLNKDGIFDLIAHLENGTNLHPRVLQGKLNQKLIDQLADIEKQLQELRFEDSRRVDEIEEIKEQAYDAIKDDNVETARAKAQDAKKVISEISTKPPNVITRAGNLIRYTRYILREYNWALPPDYAYNLTNIVEDTEKALKEGDLSCLEKIMKELNDKLDNLPRVVQLLDDIKWAIDNRVRPQDPELAQKLQSDFEELVKAIKVNDPTVKIKLDKIIDILNGIKDKIPKCPNRKCGKDLKEDQFICPYCGHDRRLLDYVDHSSITDWNISS
jgi:molecular chaperone DnaK